MGKEKDQRPERKAENVWTRKRKSAGPSYKETSDERRASGDACGNQLDRPRAGKGLEAR